MGTGVSGPEERRIFKRKPPNRLRNTPSSLPRHLALALALPGAVAHGRGARRGGAPVLRGPQDRGLGAAPLVADLDRERGQNRDPKKIAWSLYSVKKCLTDAIWSLEVSY